MSYTVLARKWRPKNFPELVGQTHVMQALANALDQQRLHHAYLFTGTRGVGKTTIARIFAKALNCEQGISSTPCGVCSVCKSIDEGRFVDLIEVDAASRTKVEDTREILDNVQYAPTQGRYKVYLIDEVHMLSKSSFNALLKTLEEPPQHVKFLLATTDPHKLPITVLSRCLQFNLLRLTSVQIQQHLAYILQQEQIEFDPSALALIAKSADGSARDSLSLLDQSIAYCGGRVSYDAVQAMLGLVDQGMVQAVLQALSEQSAEQIKQILQTLASLGVDYVALLNQLVEALHQIAQTQVLGEALDEAVLPPEVLSEFAQNLTPEQIQLFYQIGLLARQDMKLAPDIRIGFEMTLLRMLAFQPTLGSMNPENPPPSVSGNGGQRVADLLKTAQTNKPVTAPIAKSTAPQESAAEAMTQVAPVANPQVAEAMPDLSQFPALQARLNKQSRPANSLPQTPAVQSPSSFAEPIQPAIKVEPAIANAFSPTHQQSNVAPAQTPISAVNTVNDRLVAEDVAAFSLAVEDDRAPWEDEEAYVESEHFMQQDAFSAPLSPQSVESTAKSLTNNASLMATSVSAFKPQPIELWLDLINQVQADGMGLELARHCVLLDHNHQAWWLAIDPQEQAAKTDMAITRLQQAAQRRFGDAFQLHFVEYAGEFFTPNRYDNAQQQLTQQQARESIHQDQNVQAMQQKLGMQLLENSIQPL